MSNNEFLIQSTVFVSHRPSGGNGAKYVEEATVFDRVLLGDRFVDLLLKRAEIFSLFQCISTSFQPKRIGFCWGGFGG